MLFDYYKKKENVITIYYVTTFDFKENVIMFYNLKL